MKKQLLFFAIILVFLSGVLLWWNGNTIFLYSANSKDISIIKVFNGNTGNHFIIDNQSDIQHIVSLIQARSYKKDGISIGKMGTLFTLSLYDKNSNVMSTFTINSADTVRKDPFFYKASVSNADIIDFLTDIDNKQN